MAGIVIMEEDTEETTDRSRTVRHLRGGPRCKRCRRTVAVSPDRRRSEKTKRRRKKRSRCLGQKVGLRRGSRMEVRHSRSEALLELQGYLETVYLNYASDESIQKAADAVQEVYVSF